MAQSTVLQLTSLIILLAVTSSAKDQGRWSRQISSYTSDISDWVPLPGPVEREPPLPPIKRQAVAEPRILTEPFPGFPRPSGFSPDNNAFPARNYFNVPANRQLYLQSVPSVPSAPQNYLSDQGFGQSLRFGLSQPNFPLNQGFISPQFGYDGVPQSISMPQNPVKPQAQSNPIKFESYQKNTPFQVPKAIPVKAFSSQSPKIKQEVPMLIDGYRAENASNEYGQKRRPQSLQKIKFENNEAPIPRPVIPQNVPKQQNNQKLEREEVQLLYVPLESLNRGQFNFKSPLTSSQLLNTDFYSQGVSQVPHKKSTTELYRPIQKTGISASQDYFTEFNSQLHSLPQKNLDQVPKFSTLTSLFPTSPPTTPKPKKLKPHQPPLAIFLTEEASKNNQIKVGDVLASLKTQNSVAVLDSVNPLNAPKVFIGPSSLQPPEHYVKFELPYLSNIENSDKKLRQLPFFVAPLSYNTPQGFAKIPFPSPHVGSVVINSQIKETTTERPSTENFKPSYYTGTYRQEQKLVTNKPTVSFYTTAAPKTNLPHNYQSNFYQFEPQTVSTLRPLKEPDTVTPPRPGSYFLNNAVPYSPQYDPASYELTPQNNYQRQPETEVKPYNIPKQVETTTTPRTTVSTTTKLPSTYPSQLLETHNPYSINQAFHFSTPLDYRTYMDEFKEPVAIPVVTDSLSTPPRPMSTTSQTPRVEEVVTEQQKYQQPTSPQYQSYTPEIHYESEIQNSRYSTYNTNDYSTKTESIETYSPVQSSNTEYNPSVSNPTEYNENQETQAPTQDIVQNQNPSEEESKLPSASEVENPTRYEPNQYETSFDSNEGQTSSTTSTTTTRRPLRVRGRPRYTTTPKTESGEYSTRSVTRRPLRERRPLPTRTRYEPNKITTEKPTRKPVDYSEESTTKTSRTRIRGRVTYKPTDDIYDRKRTHNSKEQDLAYQRDVLHQNYPVTIQERSSTVDIEAITEPTGKLSSTKFAEPNTETYDTENAYTYERATVSQQNANSDSNEDIPVFPSRTTVAHSETSYVPRLSTRNEDYVYHSRSSIAPVDSVSYDETFTEKEESNPKVAMPVQRTETEPVTFVTESISLINQNKEQSNSDHEEYPEKEQETTTTAPEIDVTKEISHETEEENIVQTTPSYNRVRVRPGVIRQYHQSSTESSKIKTDRRRPVTYRPAFDKRRTTMRIDEIQQDLKTKQVKGRLDEDYRHPVYKPETSSEATSTQESTTKRSGIRRRRPSHTYTTSTTEESPARKNTYDVKNRLRRRRPTTEKATQITETQNEPSTTTVRTLYSRYSHKPRLSERYTQKPETEETEDQDSNFSINRPRYTEPDTIKWSANIASDSFKPYNPNNIVDEDKLASTDRRSDKIELDIITARNEYEDLLVSVTPATNNRNNKKIPEIPPTLEALVEQSKVTKSDASDNMSTFESMLEEVMKSLEEQDEDEYTTNVMKHKGGEIGEIPPERVISSDDSYNTKTTLPLTQEATTVETTTTAADNLTTTEEEHDRKSHRRGFWKKVKVRPVAAESIEVAESQYYTNTVNRLGQPLKPEKSTQDKLKHEKKVSVTTYKPTFQFVKDIFSSEDDTANEDGISNIEISKVSAEMDKIEKEEEYKTTEAERETQTEKTEVSPGDFDLGTGSPDPTMDNLYSTTTETMTPDAIKQGFSFINYLFGTTSEDDSNTEVKNETTTNQIQIEITTELAKTKMPTTESTFMPDEITVSTDEEDTSTIADIKKVSTTTPKEETTTTESPKIETTSQSTFMNPANVVSTSMSTEISHETEICFRGKCIKTSRDVL